MAKGKKARTSLFRLGLTADPPSPRGKASIAFQKASPPGKLSPKVTEEVAYRSAARRVAESACLPFWGKEAEGRMRVVFQGGHVIPPLLRGDDMVIVRLSHIFVESPVKECYI